MKKIKARLLTEEDKAEQEIEKRLRKANKILAHWREVRDRANEHIYTFVGITIKTEIELREFRAKKKPCK